MIKQFISKTAAFWLLLLSSMLLTACGSSDSSSGNDNNAPPSEPPKLVNTEAEAAKFLTRATFGATPEQIDQLLQLDAEQWVDQQISTPASSHLQRLTQTYADNGLEDITDLEIVGQRALLFTDNWWHFAVNADDQLRQRVAFALSQIFVVSLVQDSEFNKFRGFANYQDMLASHAFGNFRDLLQDVTLSPIMGDYLSMRRNEKPNPDLNIRPDENYARELLQLFSIGLNRLNLDGTLELDGQGNPIPTYDQDVIEGFAHVFTGWNYSDALNFRSDFRNADTETEPMRAFEAFHDREPKLLLDGQVLPADQDALVDLNQALDIVFAHPNVGPFMSKQLIQRLVTSNPSPAYVERVARVFNDNGSGVRGDLGAVVKAILIDGEALNGGNNPQADFGKLKEPMLRLTSLFRAFDAQGESGDIRFAAVGLLGQFPYYSPSVFNFYRPDYAQPGEIEGEGLVAPEFQILTESTITNTTNVIQLLAYELALGNDPQGPFLRIVFDYSEELAIAEDEGALIDHLNLRLMAGQMTAATRQTLIDYIGEIPPTEQESRVKEAVFLIASSAQFAVQR